MFVNSSTDLTPKKQQTIIFTDQKKLEESIKKTTQSEMNLKNRIQKMSYKMLSECIFEIAINQPSSQPIIENYLNEQSIREQSMPLKSLTQDFLLNKNNLEEEQKKLIKMIPENQLQVMDDLNTLQQFVQESPNNNLNDCIENLQNQNFKNIIEQLNFYINNQIKQKVEKKILQFKKSNERLEQKIEIREKNLKINKHHLREYLSEIEKMREKIVNLEFTNQELRNNFDNTIQNLEQKVDQQNQKKYGNQLNDFKNKLIEKEKKINEIQILKEQKNIQETQEQKQKRVYERNIKDLNSQIELKELKIQSLQNQIKDTENLMNIEKNNFEQQDKLLQQLKQENQNLNNKIIDITFQNQQINIGEKKNLQNQIYTLNQQNLNLTQNLKVQQEKYDLLQNQYQQDKAKFNQQTKQNLDYKNQIEVLQKDYVLKDTQLQQNQFQTLQNLKEFDQIKQSQNQQLVDLQDQLQKQQLQLEQKQKDLQVVYNKCKYYQNISQEYKVQIQNLNKSFNDLQQQNLQKSSQIDQLQKIQQEQKISLQKLNSIKNSQQEQIKQQNSQIDSLSKEININKNQYSKLNQENKTFSQKQSQYIQDKQSLIEQQKQMELQINSLKTQKKQIYEELQCKSLFYQKEYLKFEEQKTLNEIKKQENIQEIQQLELQNNIQKDLSKKQIEFLSDKINQQQEELKVQNQQKENLSKLYQEMQVNNDDLKQQQSNYQQQIQKLQKEEILNKDYKQTIQLLRKEITYQKEQERLKTKQLSDKFIKVKKIKKQLQKRYTSKTCLIYTLNQKIKNSQKENEEINQKNISFIDQLQSILHDIEPLQKSISKNLEDNIINQLKSLQQKFKQNKTQQTQSTNFFSVQMRILKQEEITEKLKKSIHQKLDDILELIIDDINNLSWKQKIKIIKKHLKKNINQVQQWLKLQQEMDENTFCKTKRCCQRKLKN